MAPEKKRWLILVAGIVANLCMGTAYASSVFAAPILKLLSLTIVNPQGATVPDMTKWALAFSINLGCLPVGMLLAGPLTDRKGPRVTVAAMGALFAAGMFLAGFSSSYAWFLATFGVMMGIGSGGAYGAVVAAAVRWFPDRRGLASGLTVGALGLGTVLITPLAEILVKSQGVLGSFKIFGILFLVILVLASLVVANPPAGYCPAGWTPPPPSAKAPAAADLDWRQMLGTPRFWLLFTMYATGSFAGLMVISQAKPIAMMLDKSLFANPDRQNAFAASMVMALALANGGGRIAWGFISDKIGRMASLAAMFLVTLATMAALAAAPGLAKSPASLAVALCLIGFCFGGYLGTFPALCAEAFGIRNAAVNYAVLFFSFSVGAVSGPYAAGYVKNATGGYGGAFTMAAVVAALGLLVTLGTMLGARKAAPSQLAD